MNILITSLARLLIFPGLVFAVPAAWFFLWVERKAVARMQGRIGPPFMQPFYDFIKLVGKDTPQRTGAGGMLMKAWPLIAVSAAAGAVGLLPVLPASGGFQGDLILLLALLEVPSMCIIAAGFSSRSIFGEIGSAREAVLSVSYLSLIHICLRQLQRRSRRPAAVCVRDRLGHPVRPGRARSHSGQRPARLGRQARESGRHRDRGDARRDRLPDDHQHVRPPVRNRSPD